ncbi:MAG: hypothetical protein QOG39_154, partial [Acidimicrobiaceae bacterium]
MANSVPIGQETCGEQLPSGGEDMSARGTETDRWLDRGFDADDAA